MKTFDVAAERPETVAPRRRRPPVRATRLRALDAAVADLVGDRDEDAGIGLALDAVRAVAAARELDDLAAGIELCRRAAAALAGVS